jgi:hypothetical protein
MLSMLYINRMSDHMSDHSASKITFPIQLIKAKAMVVINVSKIGLSVLKKEKIDIRIESLNIVRN